MQVPKARKLPSGNWFIQLRLGGESIPVTETTQRKCEGLAAAIKAQYKLDKTNNANAKAMRDKASENITLRQAIENYIDSRRNVISPYTVRTYNGYKKNRFQTVIDKRLKDITNWQEAISSDAAKYTGKSMRSAWMFIAGVLKAQGVKVPNVTLPQVITDEPEYLEPEHIPVFVNAVMDSDVAIPALLALHGLRLSEIHDILKNKPENIDLKKSVIRVRGAVVVDENNKHVSKSETKNSSSRRDVPILIPELSLALSAHDGNLMTLAENTIRKHINSICEANGLPRVGVHGLRHSFASLGYHLGVSEAYMMKIGGWKDYNTLRKIYTHLASKDALKSEQKLQGFFNNANENANVEGSTTATTT